MDNFQLRAFLDAKKGDDNSKPIIVIVKGDENEGDRNQDQFRVKNRPIIIKQKESVDKPIKIVNKPVFIKSRDESESYEHDEFPKLKRRKNNKEKADKGNHYHYLPARQPHRPIRPPLRPPVQYSKCDDLNPDKVIMKSRVDENGALVIRFVKKIIENFVTG